jgi:3-deoxy-D-manno-octulosonate 8-phosphate phosphatase (KDO 8-P phosphatase)
MDTGSSNSGVKVGIITGRVSKIVEKRARELGIEEVYQDQDNKIEAYTDVKEKLNLTDEEIAYIGDDEPDVPVLECAGFSAAPADAALCVFGHVDYVCRRRGGKGAVREVIDLILNASK